jgi:hypothetical protein
LTVAGCCLGLLMCLAAISIYRGGSWVLAPVAESVAGLRLQAASGLGASLAVMPLIWWSARGF